MPTFKLEDLRDGSVWYMNGESYSEVLFRIRKNKLNPITLYPTLPSVVHVVDIEMVGRET